MRYLGDQLPALRAERLRVVLEQFQGVPALEPAEAICLTPLTAWGAVCAEAFTDEDLALASSALSLEAELRERGWAAVERLGALVAGMSGSVQERVLALDGAEFARAASCVVALGWLDGEEPGVK